MKRIVFAKCKPLMTFFMLLSIFFFTQQIYAEDITIYETRNARETISPNSVGYRIGDVIVTGITVTPNGDLDGDGFADSDGSSPPSTIIASQGDVEFELLFYPQPNNPNFFVRGVPYDEQLVDSWLLKVTNEDDYAEALSPDIIGVEAMPFVTSMSLTGSGTTPTFNWTVPDGSNPDSVSIMILDLQDFIGPIARVIYSNFFEPTRTSFEMPDGILVPDHLYSVSIQLNGLRSSSVPQINRIERLSRAFFDFSTEILEVPDDAPVYLPTVDPTGSPTGGTIYTFDMEVESGHIVFIDPVVAVGYDYETGDGDPNFASVLLPEVGDNSYSLYLYEDGNYVFKAFLIAGEEYSFPSTGVNRFRIMGIEETSGLDPNNATAFPTGLSFVSNGRFTGTMTPIVVDQVNQVDIDIKPGSEPNCFKPDERGVISVAIFGSTDFNVDYINPDSLLLQGLAVKMVGKSNKYLMRTDYVNEDDYLDIIVQFEDSDGWTGIGEEVAKLTGTLIDGTLFEGEDYICIVP